jgi:hypothetical protein
MMRHSYINDAFKIVFYILKFFIAFLAQNLPILNKVYIFKYVKR